MCDGVGRDDELRLISIPPVQRPILLRRRVENQSKVLFLRVGQLQNHPGLRQQHTRGAYPLVLKKEENQLNLSLQKIKKEIRAGRLIPKHLLIAIHKINRAKPYLL